MSLVVRNVGKAMHWIACEQAYLCELGENFGDGAAAPLSAFHWITQLFSLMLIGLIVIYPVDSAIAQAGGQATILDKTNGKPRTPPTNQKWENGAFLPFARLHP